MNGGFGLRVYEGYRPILAAFRLMSSTAAVTVLSGAATNKVIAVVAGLEGIALMGLYRNVGAMVSRPLAFGFDTILVQRVSTARSEREAAGFLGLTAWLLGLQALVVVLIGACLAGPLARWAFGPGEPWAHLTEVRVVVAMGYVNLVLQMVTAALGGRVVLKSVATVGLASSLATLALIYPLLRLGRVGLALNVGSGSLVGAAIGAYLVWGVYRPAAADLSPSRAWRLLVGALPSSTALTVHPVLMMAGMVTLQSLVSGGYGLDGLGAYNAAVAVIDVCVLVLMSAVRSYYLPSLGQLEGAPGRQEFMARVFGVLLFLAAPAATLLALGARPVISLLFSARFAAAADLLAALSLSLVGQVFVWFFNGYLLHRGRFGLVLAVDAVWAAVFVGGVVACTRLGLPLGSVAWCYVSSYTLSGALYAAACVGLYGRDLLGRREVGIALAAFATVWAGYVVSRLDSRGAEVLALVPLGAVVYSIAKVLDLRSIR
jgi:PST family polysaccharide transporter